MLEIYGYICSVVVAISFLTKNMTTLRIMNCIGCVMFGIYGYFKDAPPIIIINAFVTIIHLYYLLKIIYENNRKKVFKK